MVSAYTDDDLAVPCSNCGAPEGETCRNPINGEEAHIACVARLKLARP